MVHTDQDPGLDLLHSEVHQWLHHQHQDHPGRHLTAASVILWPLVFSTFQMRFVPVACNIFIHRYRCFILFFFSSRSLKITFLRQWTLQEIKWLQRVRWMRFWWSLEFSRKIGKISCFRFPYWIFTERKRHLHNTLIKNCFSWPFSLLSRSLMLPDISNSSNLRLSQGSMTSLQDIHRRGQVKMEDSRDKVMLEVTVVTNNVEINYCWTRNSVRWDSENYFVFNIVQKTSLQRNVILIYINNFHISEVLVVLWLTERSIKCILNRLNPPALMSLSKVRVVSSLLLFFYRSSLCRTDFHQCIWCTVQSVWSGTIQLGLESVDLRNGLRK